MSRQVFDSIIIIVKVNRAGSGDASFAIRKYSIYQLVVLNFDEEAYRLVGGVPAR